MNGTLMDLAAGLNGTVYSGGAQIMVPCPVCQPEGRKDQRGMRIKYGDLDGRVIVSCWKSGCRYPEVVRALRHRNLWPLRKLTPLELEAVKQQAEDRHRYKESQARLIWKEAIPVKDTQAAKYLRGRGIDCELPESLRYSASCWHAPSEAAYPALIARVLAPHGTGIHRTYLSHIGADKAPVDPNKMMLGTTAGGGTVLTNSPSLTLVVTEGIENGLSALSGKLAPYFGPCNVVAALSATGLAGLSLPPAREGAKLVIAGDGDDAGLKAAKTLETHAAPLGWKVFHAPAPADQDWNSVLRSMS